MSSITTERIKKIRQKQGNSFPNSIPIGTDGSLVDMISNLDLEEEIKLGGNHYVSILSTNNNTSTIIKEWYLSIPKGDRTIEEIEENYSDKITYTVITTIESAVQINLGPQKDTDEQNYHFVTWKNPHGQDVREYDEDDPTTFGDSLVVKNQVDQRTTTIDIRLFLGKAENGNELHHKIVYLYESDSNNEGSQIIINEQVNLGNDNEGSENNNEESEVEG